MKPHLEALEDRTLPSASSLPAVFEASPPAASSVAAITSYVFGIMEQRVQLIATLEQDLSRAWNALGQQIAQEVSSVQQQVGRILGINPNLTNQSTAAQIGSGSGAGRGNGSGSGSGSGATTTAHNTSSQALNYSTQQIGSGSGSGSSGTSAHENTTQNVRTKVHPLTSGYGCGSTATISGQLWLDSNYDGSVDNGELDYSGATINLLDYNPSTGVTTLGAMTTTNTNLSGQNYQFIVGAGSTASYYEIQVVFPWSFFATKQTGYSQINAQGYSPVFSLTAGATEIINAGISSMNVNTTDDKAVGKIQDKVMLRDAIQAGNNGAGPEVTFYQDQNTLLSGTISLQAALDPISASFNIAGPGSGILTLNANGNAANPRRVYSVNAGATSTINGLKLTGGYENFGGGIDNSGTLTLNNVTLLNNQATGGGGAIFNSNGANLTMDGVSVNNNSTDGSGGGILNYGNLTCQDSSIMQNNANNVASGNGGGLANYGGKAEFNTATKISGNTAINFGGGIYENAGTVSLSRSFGTGLTINNNSASAGGGIYVNSGVLKLTDRVSVSNNKATGGTGGGGIAIASGQVKISGGSMKDNFAQNGSGGGLLVNAGKLTIKNENVSYNTAENNGGGMYLFGGTATVSGSEGTMQSNEAGNSGGGIYNYLGTLTLDNAIHVNDNIATNQGGGLYLKSSSTTNINSCIVSGNSATTGKGIYWQNNAIVNILPGGLVDDDDPGGQPVKGP